MEVIKFKNVYKTFEEQGQVVKALKKTSFTLNSGELVAIVGPSGSGKSTLLTMMGGLQRPTGGTILFNGEDLSKMDEKKRNELRFNKIGFVLQSSNLVPYLTINEQFELVDKFSKNKRDEEKSNKILEKLGILNRKKQYSGDLSGGEKQRAAIARALYTSPSLLLADEPTAALDSKRAIEVIKILKKLTKENNQTTVIVTHDERLLEYCNRVFRVLDGVLTEE